MKFNFNPSLEIFNSPEILIINNCHGFIDHYQPGNQKIVVYCLLGEKGDPNLVINELKEKFKNAYIFYITVNDYEKEIDSEYNGEFIHQPTGYVGYYAKNMPFLELDNVRHRKISKHFLSLNNRASFSRHCIWQVMVKYDLLKLSYFSYLFHDRDNQGLDNVWNQLQDMTAGNWFNLGINWEEERIKLPLRIDDFADNSWSYDNPDYYRTSFLSLVNETYISDFLTEKTMKPLAYGHPFMIINCKNSLAILKRLGFKTFDQLIDESHDDKDGPENIEHCIREILKISKFSQDQISQLTYQVADVIEHNYNHFWNVLPAQDDRFVQTAIIPKIISKAIELGISIRK